MKILLLLFLGFVCKVLDAQTAKDYSVLLSAVVQKSPPKITLNWNYHAGATSYNIYRKAKSDNTWGSPIANLTGSDTFYQDNNVTVGTGYEYRVEKVHPSLQGAANTFNGFFHGGTKTNNFIYSGIELPDEIVKGRLILVIDSSVYDSIKVNINQWILDAQLEGWMVSSLKVSRLMTAENVKTLIVNEYQKDPSNTKAVFIVGHVPVPYSGEFKYNKAGYYSPPDGHSDHLPSWPADVYYGDMDGTWTDNKVNDTSQLVRNRNVIGDGKWDQTSIYPDNSPELQVGRVDFANMTAFSKTEIQLLNDYLVKCHNYKIGQYKANKRGLIDDNFGSFSGESFASNGWNTFSSVIGKNNILLCDTVSDYINTMDTASYMWSFGCGAGSSSSCNGIGTSNNLASKNIKTVFTMLFGSYFGDWDSPNNFLRAALASGTTLSCVWSGRPRWYFHHMGLGETTGYATTLTQNNVGDFTYNSGTYPSFSSGGLIHIALMGDPSLRMNYVTPPSNLSLTLMDSAHVSLSWLASPESVLGYNVYRKSLKSIESNWIKLNKSNLTTMQFTDSCVAIPDSFIYQIRAVKLETTASGTYLNESISVRDTIYIGFSNKSLASFTVTNADPKFDFVNTSKNSKSYKWTFSDTTLTSSTADVSRTYKKNGTYWVLLATTSQCSQDTQKMTIKVTKITITPTPPPINSSISNVFEEIKIYPNPVVQKLEIQTASKGRLMLYELQGKQVFIKDIEHGTQSIDFENYKKGIYILKFENLNGQSSDWKVVKE